MLAPWKKSFDKHSVIISTDITLPTKVCIVKAMVLLVHVCECWTIKKAECQRTDAFECGGGEDSCESFGQQREQTSPS